MRAHAIVLLAGLAPALGAAETEHVGAGACAPCHAEQFESQSRSAHAAALRRAKEHPLLPRIEAASRARDGRWSYEIAPAGDRDAPAFRLRRGDEVYERVIEWAFGSGYQAVTFVSQLDEDAYLEHHLSYYTQVERLGLTPGHQTQPVETPTQALGVRYPTFSPRSEILRCFRCHSTGPLGLTEDFAVQPSEPGVRCEACHGPGATHIAEIEAGRVAAARQAIENPGRLDAPALMTYCGGCHRPPDAGDGPIDWRDPWNVRHQPVYLSRSACFRESADGLKCMTCHDPHEPIRRDDPGYYNARCVSCHSSESDPPAETCSADAGCASCHMPAVRPQSELAFHNHWIGVYGAEPLVPRDSTDASASRTSATNGSAGP